MYSSSSISSLLHTMHTTHMQPKTVSNQANQNASQANNKDNRKNKESSPLNQKLRIHVIRMSESLLMENVLIENLNEFIEIIKKNATKENESHNHILDPDSIRVSKQLLYYLLRVVRSLTPFHSNCLRYIQGTKDLINFFETQCCDEDNKPLDCNIIEIDYNIIWCVSAMHKLINKLNNPILKNDNEVNNWLEDYNQYKERSNYKSDKLTLKKSFWADYENALLSYLYLQEAKTLFNSNDTQSEGKEKLLLAEKEADQSLMIYQDYIANVDAKQSSTKRKKNKESKKIGGTYGIHHDCAVLCIYHELYKFYVENDLLFRGLSSVEKILTVCRQTEKDIIHLSGVLQKYETIHAHTETGTRVRLRKKLEKQRAAKESNTVSKNTIKWIDILKEQIKEVESYLFTQMNCFNEWKISINESKKENDLKSKYNKVQDVIKAFHLLESFLRTELDIKDFTIHLTISEKCDTKSLVQCLFSKKNITNFDFRIRKNSQLEFVIVFLNADKLDTDILQESLQNYIVQCSEKTETKSEIKIMATSLTPSISSSPPSIDNAKVELEKNEKELKLKNEKELEALDVLNKKIAEQEEIARLNREATQKRRETRNPKLFQENMNRALEKYQNIKELQPIKYQKTQTLESSEYTKESQKENEKQPLSKMGSDTIYDETKLLIAFKLLTTDLTVNDDDKQHILFGCILHIILELDYRLRYSDSHYNFNPSEKNELKIIIQKIRNTVVHQLFDLKILTNSINCLLPLEIFFHKNCYEKNSEISKKSFDMILNDFIKLEEIICAQDLIVTNQEISNHDNDIAILEKMKSLINNFINFNMHYNQKHPNDMQLFLCLGMVIQIQECTNLFSTSFIEIYGNQLDQFRLYRNQLAHRDKIIINAELSLQDDYTILNWNKMFKTITKQAPDLLEKVNGLQLILQEQYIIESSTNQYQHLSPITTGNSIFSLNENIDESSILFNGSSNNRPF